VHRKRAYRGHQRAHNVASPRSACTPDAPPTQKKRQNSPPPACHALTRTARDPDEAQNARTNTRSAPPANPTEKHNSRPHIVRPPLKTLSPGLSHSPHTGHTPPAHMHHIAARGPTASARGDSGLLHPSRAQCAHPKRRMNQETTGKEQAPQQCVSVRVS